MEYDRFTWVRHFKIKITTHLLKIKKLLNVSLTIERRQHLEGMRKKKIKNASN